MTGTQAPGGAPEAPEVQVAWDIVRRGLLAAGPILGLLWVVFGAPTALSVGFGLGVVLVNFVLSAYLLRWAAAISLALVASVSLGGFALRLGLVTVAVLLVIDQPWVRLVPLGLAIIVAHLGLLTWELRYISASSAHPGLKPRQRRSMARPAAGYRRKWLAERSKQTREET